MNEYMFVWKNGGWWLKINTIEQLIDYYEKTEPKWSEALDSLLKSKEFGQGQYHASELAYTIGFYGSNRHLSPTQAVTDFRSSILENQLNSLYEYGEIYINRKGGYHFKYGDEKYTQFVRKKELVFPAYKSSDIRIKRFPGGAHFYAYIGDMQVKDGNVLKWNTYEEAYQKANELVTNLKG